MRKLVAFLLLTAAASAATTTPNVQVAEVPFPSHPRSLGPALTAAPDGTPWLSWIESGSSGTTPRLNPSAPGSKPRSGSALRFATLDCASRTWRTPGTIAADGTVATNPADFPQLALDGRGNVFAVWTDGRGGAFTATSADQGKTWTAPAPWAPAGNAVEKFSLARLSDGRVLVAWLDGRDPAGGKALYARVLAPGAIDERVDASVGDGCPTAIAPLLDGGAVVAYRGRTAAEIRDIRVARRRENRWSAPRTLEPDHGKIAAGPGNGPRVATDGSRLAAAWFTATGDEPRVLASYSPDAGTRWLSPTRVDCGHPVGHVDTVLLHDGTILVAWLETDGSLWLRRISPEFSRDAPVPLAPAHTASIQGVPRLLLLRDYAGGHSGAELLVAFTGAGAAAGIRTFWVTVPEGDLLVAERNCDCAPTPEELEGFPIRGEIVAVDPVRDTVQLRHDEVPGVFAAGTRDFSINALTLAYLRTGAELLGRIRRPSDGAWELDHVQLLGAAIAPERK